MDWRKDYLTRLDSINEVYAGKIPDILEIENKIAKARKKYLDKGYTKWEDIRGTTNDKDIDVIAKEIAKVFGFYSCILLITPEIMPNAATSPVTFCVDMVPEEHVIPYKGGYKYDTKLKYCTYIYTTTAIFCNPDYSDAEVTAILLHEIGHNFVMTKKICLFYKSLRDTYEILKLAQKAGELTKEQKDELDQYEKLLTMDARKNNSDLLRKEVIDVDDNTARSNEWYFGTKSKMENIFSAIGDFITELITLGIPTTLNKIYTISFVNKNVDKELSNLEEETIRYRSMEYLADSFATVYGYGPELSSALYKLETGKNRYINLVRFLPINALVKKFLQLPYFSAMYMIVDHPNSAARMNHMLVNLKAEVKKEKIDDKTKQCLLENIAEIEALQKEIESYEKNWKFFDKYHYAKAFLALVTKRKDAPTSRELDYASSKEVDKFYDKLLKKK